MLGRLSRLGTGTPHGNIEGMDAWLRMSLTANKVQTIDPTRCAGTPSNIDASHCCRRLSSFGS